MEVIVQLTIDGRAVRNESDFHEIIKTLLAIGPHYGANLDALWDQLSTDTERPLTLIWKDSNISRERLGATFDRITEVLDRVKKQDQEWGLEDRFDYRLE
jgi:ribonuclease inhibitor